MYEPPRVQASKADIFGSEYGVKSYSWSFYSAFPTLSGGPIREAGVVDYAACRSVNGFYLDGVFNSQSERSWDWEELRNVNYYLDGLADKSVCPLDDDVRMHYEAIGRFFRAWYYYGMLKTYGGVPWFDHCVSSTDEAEMYRDRDNRDVIIGHIIEDLNFAAAHLKTEESKDNTLVSKYAVWAFKSRVCLFEASYRKYHNMANEKPAVPSDTRYTPTWLFNQAEAAAEEVISSKKFSLNTEALDASKEYQGSYRKLFYSSAVVTKEVILGVAGSDVDKMYGEANWRFFSGSYGNGYCGCRTFVHTYLKKDGTPFTSTSGYASTEYKNEFADRDERLAQTFMPPSYTMTGGGGKVVPDIVGLVAPTGYAIIKFVLDNSWYNGRSRNTNSYPIIRYAEVLLNYAEARRELGTFTNDDWAATIGALRKRAGITGGLTSCPTTVDTWFQSHFYPTISDATLLEIRRERAIELFYEGFRQDDLRRWNYGSLIQSLPWDGLHIPALDTPINIDGSGSADYYFSYKSMDEISSAYRSIHVRLYPDSSSEQGLRAHSSSGGGYDLEYVLSTSRRWYDDGRQNLKPIPANIIADYTARGYHLTQNYGW